ncbi:MAG: glycogen/starch synthase [Bernardetiaceae bacterium]|jgi:starch synthase|nr:glycogen/starch synthase [Bernardetiaceae bacterium]
MSRLKILYVSSEIDPFLKTSAVSDYVRKLPQAMQERGMEIRILVPRFGLINERKNRLHEVVRLSGINIAVGDEEKPLVIKVASVPNAKLQVYFIDNDDYFNRKSVFTDKDNRFYSDNDDRAIFFCKGVIETVKKLGWAPDIVHCNDWMTGLIPLYLKTTYKNDPMFKDAKAVFTIYDDSYFDHQFDASLPGKVKMLDIDDAAVASLQTYDYKAFIKIGAQYSDTVTKADRNVDNRLADCYGQVRTDEVPTIEESAETFSDAYYQIYNSLKPVPLEAAQS